MANLEPLKFIPEQIEDLGDGFKVVAPGWYLVVMVDSDIQDTKAGGKMLVCKNQITTGPCVGEILIDRINIVNSSDQAQKIGLSQLKNICDAVNHAGILKDSAQLHGKVYAVKVTVEDFESNKTGKTLKSNKIEKRLSKEKYLDQNPVSSKADGPNTAAKTSMSW